MNTRVDRAGPLRRHIQALSQLGQAALRAKHADTLFEAAVKQLSQALDCDYCFLLQQEGPGLRLIVGPGWPSDAMLPGSQIAPEALLTAALNADAPLIFDSLQREPRFQLPAFLAQHGIVSGMVSAVRAGSRAYGVAAVFSRKPIAYSPDDVQFMTAVTELVSHAVQQQRSPGETPADDHFRTVVGLVTDGTTTARRDEHDNLALEWVSGDLLQRLGYTAEQFNGEGWNRLAHPEDRERYREHVQKGLSGARDVLEMRVLSSQHELHWVRIWALPTLDHSGSLRINGAVVDITAQKRSELRLSESESRFRAIADTAPVMIWVSEADGSRTYMNRGWLEFTGRSAEDAKGFGWLKAIHAEDAATVFALYTAAHRSREPVSISCRLQRADGVYRWILLTAVPRFGQEGQFAGFIGSVVDIHDVRESEARIAQAHAVAEQERRQLRSLLETLPVGVVIADPSGKLVSMNSKLAEIWGGEAPLSTGIAEYAVYEAWWADTGLPVQPDAWNLAEALRTGKPSPSRVINIQRFDGTRGVILSAAMPIFGADGELTGAVAISTDITALKQAEETQRQAAARMQIVAEAGRAFSATISHYDNLLQSIVQQVASIYGDGCMIFLTGAHHDNVQLAAYLFPAPEDTEAVRQTFSEVGQPLVGLMASPVMNSGQPLLLTHLSVEALQRLSSKHYHALIEQIHPHSLIIVPLTAYGQNLGMMLLVRSNTEWRGYTDQDLNLAVVVADRAAVAVYNARLYLEVQEQRERFGVILSSIGDGVIATDAQGRITYINQVAQFLTRTQHKTVIGQPVETVVRLVREETRSAVENPVTAVLRTGVPARLAESRLMIAHDGTEVPVADSAAPLRDHQGVLIGGVIVFRDISERRRAERVLLESEDVFRATFHQAAVGIIHFATDGRFLLVNDRFCDVVGYSVHELAEMRLADLMLADELAGVVHHTLRLLNGEASTYTAEQRFLRRDGALVWANSSVTLLRATDGTALYFIGVVEDITERKRAEAEIFRLNAELEQRVMERTAQLTAINKELEAFSYSVSHDLRAPLRAIDGFSQALLEDYLPVLDEQGQDFLARIRTASQRMGTLIDALLMLSRLSRGGLSRTRVNLSDVALEIAADLQSLAPDRVTKWDITPDLVVHADARLMRILLENLLENAWKFTSRIPSPHISFGVSRYNGQDMYFIRDNGAGFDSRYADKLFTAFQRLHTSAEFDGTGIGLATVQRIVHRHGGLIRADGAVNQGAVFYFTIPDPGDTLNDSKKTDSIG